MAIENQEQFLESRRSRDFKGDYTEDEFSWWMSERSRRSREESSGFPGNGTANKTTPCRQKLP